MITTQNPIWKQTIHNSKTTNDWEKDGQIFRFFEYVCKHSLKLAQFE